MAEELRNIAIIAHVDHGKTTLVDKLLQQTASVSKKVTNTERILSMVDSVLLLVDAMPLMGRCRKPVLSLKKPLLKAYTLLLS